MKARCDWCGIQVEVLSDGKCLLGHPVKRSGKVPASVVDEPSPSRPPGFGLEPARSRIRSGDERVQRRPKAPTLGDSPAVKRSVPAVSVATAMKPGGADTPARLPMVSDGPTKLPKGAAAATQKTATRMTAGGRTVPRPQSKAATQRTMRKWVPLDPFGPSGPVEIVLDEPAPPATEAVQTTLAASPPASAPAAAPARAARKPRVSAAAANSPAPPTGVAANTTAPPTGNGNGLGEALRSIDWRSGAERTRDASLTALRGASTATSSAAAATARAVRATGSAVTRIDLRGILKRFGPLSPQNPAMWVAGLCIAGVALLIGLRVPGEESRPQVLGSRIVSAAELTQVPGYTLEADPATEAEVAAQQPNAKKVSAASVLDGNKVLARYQAIAFGPEIRWTPLRQKEWLEAYARNAQIPASSFAERPLGRRSVWSASLGSGQVAVYFYESEVMVLVTGEQGAGADQVIDAVLSARGV